MGYYVLIKKKSSSKWLGAIPSKKGSTKDQLKKRALRYLKSGMSAKIINTNQLKRLLLKSKEILKKSRNSTKQKTRKKSVKRKSIKKKSSKRR